MLLILIFGIVFPRIITPSISLILFINRLNIMIRFLLLSTFNTIRLSFIFYVISEIGEILIVLGWVYIINKLLLLGLYFKLGLILTIFIKNYPIEDINLKEWIIWSFCSSLSYIMIFFLLFSISNERLTIILIILNCFIVIGLIWGNISLSISSSISILLFSLLTSNISFYILVSYSTFYVLSMFWLIENKDNNSFLFFINICSFPTTVRFFIKTNSIINFNELFNIVTLIILYSVSLQIFVYFDSIILLIKNNKIKFNINFLIIILIVIMIIITIN